MQENSSTHSINLIAMLERIKYAMKGKFTEGFFALTSSSWKPDAETSRRRRVRVYGILMEIAVLA